MCLVMINDGFPFTGFCVGYINDSLQTWCSLFNDSIENLILVDGNFTRWIILTKLTVLCVASTFISNCPTAIFTNPLYLVTSYVCWMHRWFCQLEKFRRILRISELKRKRKSQFILPVQMDRMVLCLRWQTLKMFLDDIQACRMH